jgi:hypothetical protein
MIEKPTIVITSLGRTGTKFFADFFREALSDSTSLHEPDLFTTGELRNEGAGISHLLEQIREVGPLYMLIKKPLGKWSLSQLSDARVRGDLDHDKAVRETLRQRAAFIQSRQGTVYVESSTAYYGLIDLLPRVFAHHRLAYVIRDGRDWVRSWTNWGERGGMYTKGRIRSIFARNWPTALDVEDEYGARWESMPWFEKLCWAWSRLNVYALNSARDNPDARVFRFEDVFRSPDRYQHLSELVGFATDMPGVAPVPPEALEGWLDRKVHTSSGAFPDWGEWSGEQRATFSSICGPLMEQLGYSVE